MKDVVGNVSMPINQKASKVMAILKEVGLAWTAELRPRDLLVHPSNRGGQMVNGFDVAAKGQAICAVGGTSTKSRSLSVLSCLLMLRRKQPLSKPTPSLLTKALGCLPGLLERKDIPASVDTTQLAF